MGRHRHRHPAEQADLLRVRDPVRARDQHLVARVHQRHHDVVEGVLGPAGDGDLVGRVVEAVVALELLADRGAQLGHPAHLGVLGLPALHRADGRGLDARGGVEVGLAGSERDHVDALGAHGPRLGLHGEGRRGRKRLHPIGEHGVLSQREPENFWARRSSTGGGTMPVTGAPRDATSLMSREEM